MRPYATPAENLDDSRIVDYAADGSVVGVEFISPSRGMDLAGVPHPEQIARAARRRGLGWPPARRTSRGPSDRRLRLLRGWARVARYA